MILKQYLALIKFGDNHINYFLFVNKLVGNQQQTYQEINQKYFKAFHINVQCYKVLIFSRDLIKNQLLINQQLPLDLTQNQFYLPMKAFAYDLSNPISINQKQLQLIQKRCCKKQDNQSQILLGQRSFKIRDRDLNQKDSITRSSSKKLGSLLAGKKARQRKKIYLTNLEQNVQQLQDQLQKYDDQIKKAKETLTQALNSQKNNQNSYTFSELKFSVQSDDPNYDKINLLLDMIKFRIGASGKERQAKIDYFFKQVINALFPALHRYMMYTSERQIQLFEEKDIFQYLKVIEQNSEAKEMSLPWTKFFLKQLELSSHQQNQIFGKKQSFVTRKNETRQIIQKLNIVKFRIKDQEVVIQELIDDIRKCMTPVQAGTWAIFAQKYKYKRQISLQNQLELIGDYYPSKKVKPNESFN